MNARNTAALALVAALTACASPMTESVQGFLCCNQTVAKGWLSSENILGGTVIPLGSPVRVNSIKRERYAYGSIGNSEYGFSHDTGKTEAETTRWLSTIVTQGDPAREMEKFPSTVKIAISSSRVFVGMTRQQVLMAIGHPSASLNPDPASLTWKYWTAIDDDPVVLHFDASGTLTKLTGTPGGLRLVQLAM